MNKYQQLAYEFQSAPGSLYLPLPSSPTPLPEWAVDLWRRLITEEKDELIEALESGDIAQIVHEQCDLLYVLYGCACWLGFNKSWELYTPNEPFNLEMRRAFDWEIPNLLERLPYVRNWTLGLFLKTSIQNIQYDPYPVLDKWPAYQAIHAANMAKRVSGQWKDGKAVKPEGWQPADIRSVLIAQGVQL